MASAFRIGQRIEGKFGTYVISKQLHKDIWAATHEALPGTQHTLSLALHSTSNRNKVIIKATPKYRLDNERDVLKHFHGRPGIRQLLDETHDPPSVVLRHLDSNRVATLNLKRLEKSEINFIAKDNP